VVLNQFIIWPVGREGDIVFIGNLEGFENSENFRHIAADFSRIEENKPDDAFRVNYKDRSDRFRSAPGVNHAQAGSHPALIISNDREGNFHFKFILNPLNPFDVAENLIN